MPFVIPLQKSGEPLSRQIYFWFRNAILKGLMRGGQRLPSTRELAEDLRISRTVVVVAYEHLLAEGFVVGHKGSGTYVSEGLGSRRLTSRLREAKVCLSRFGASAQAAASRVNFPTHPSRPLRYDFAYGRSDVEIFPFKTWRRILLRHARKAPVRELDYGPTAGSIALRRAISAHLQRSRAVVCDPSQVIVVNGSQQALDLITRVLIERGDRVAIEDPSYQGTREVLLAAGARLLPVPVDSSGLDPAKLPKEVRLAFVTPSHQFPTGAILPLARRMDLLDWARQNDVVIVEDDYDGEFRYEEQSLESLQGLDSDGRVIYIGTFSRTIFSALRIGYLIVPKSLVRAFTSAKWLCDRHTATLEQETLAEFIASGMYERHLRRLRQRNAIHRKTLLDAVRNHMGDRVAITGDGAGAHIVLWPRKGISERSFVKNAASCGVGVYGISRYFSKQPSKVGLLLGYSRLSGEEIREGIRRLSQFL